jgi:Spy/CpxP family protein refolding chaperone
MENLNLTAEQKTKMEQLRQSSRTQIEALLNPEQRKVAYPSFFQD